MLEFSMDRWHAEQHEIPLRRSAFCLVAALLAVSVLHLAWRSLWRGAVATRRHSTLVRAWSCAVITLRPLRSSGGCSRSYPAQM